MDSTASQKTVGLFIGFHCFLAQRAFRHTSIWITCLLCPDVIAKRNDNSLVTLTCRTAGEGPLVWKLNDEDVDFEYHYERDGKNLIVSEIDAPLLGEYSCWRGGEKLSSTFLLQEAEEQTDKENKKTGEAIFRI